MVQIDIPIVFGIGCAFADAARRGLQDAEPRARAEAFYRGLTANLVFLTLFVSWLPVYLLVRNFGFETSHMWWHLDSIHDYPFFLPVFLVVFFLMNLAGYGLGTRWVGRGRIVLNRAVAGAMVLFSLVWVFGQSHRTLVLGTYREWAAGAARPLSSDPYLLPLLGVSALLFTAGVVASYRWVRKGGREERDIGTSGLRGV
jgi:hypothetical protein